MGGFHYKTGEKTTKRVGLEFITKVALLVDNHLCHQYDEYRATIISVLDHYLDEINDKSNADPMVKFVACLQVVWFLIIVLVRRIVQPSLPITQLEISTCAYIVCAIGTWVLWWDKPYNVQYPIMIPAPPMASLKLSAA